MLHTILFPTELAACRSAAGRAILAPGPRTAASILRTAGLSQERRTANYHCVLNCAAWSGSAAARGLLKILLDAFLPTGPVLLGFNAECGRMTGQRALGYNCTQP